jgi:5'-3' exonuclease
MYKTNQIDAIITEDTDLVALGNNNILFKLDKDGECFSVSHTDLQKIPAFKDFKDGIFKLIYTKMIF